MLLTVLSLYVHTGNQTLIHFSSTLHFFLTFQETVFKEVYFHATASGIQIELFPTFLYNSMISLTSQPF